MTYEQFLKVFKRASARYALNMALWLIRHLPYRFIKGVMHFFLFLWYRFAVRLRRIARESLLIAFGQDITETERRRIISRCFENVGRSMTDLIYFSQFPDGVTEKFRIDNRHYLDQALQQGKGIILVTAHFGNFCLMMLDLAQRGYKINCIIRRARDADVDRTIFESMSRVRVKPIYSTPPRQSVQDSLKVLRNNEILCVLLDQHFGSGSGVYVDFFGRKAATATGPVILARRTGAPVLPVFTIREDDQYRIMIEPPVVLEKEDDEAAITRDVAKLTGIIEDYVRRYPTEWGWMHRRWKS